MSLAFDEYGRPFLIIKVRLHTHTHTRARARSFHATIRDLRIVSQSARVLRVFESQKFRTKHGSSHFSNPRAKKKNQKKKNHDRTNALLLSIVNRRSHSFPIQEQSTKQRLSGIEAQKQNISAAKSVARTLRSSLGPKVSPFVFVFSLTFRSCLFPKATLVDFRVTE